jgi:hypothetical protein
MNRQIIGTLAITLFAAACSDPGSVTGPDSGLDAVFSRDASSGHV